MANIDELARKERLEYFKAWRAANPERTKKHRDDYWKRRAEKRRQQVTAQQEQEAHADDATSNSNERQTSNAHNPTA